MRQWEIKVREVVLASYLVDAQSELEAEAIFNTGNIDLITRDKMGDECIDSEVYSIKPLD